jgi:hypothetical protein
MTNEHYKTLLSVLIVMCCVFGCSWYESYKKDKQREEKKEAQRQDSIRKAFIADSLAHDPHYQDSIRKAEEKYRRWKLLNDSISKDELVGFILLDGDSCYHNAFHPVVNREDGILHNYSILDIPQLRFVTMRDIVVNRYKYCPVCKEIEDVYLGYEDGEIINVDEVREYVSENQEDFEDLFSSEPEEPDFDNDRW